MKSLRKIFSGLLLVSILAVCFATSAFAVIETEAGKTVTVEFNIESSYGVNGYFEFSNKPMFESVEISQDSTLAGEISNDRVYIFGKESTTVTIKLDVKVVTSAKPGDSCTIKFTYELADKDGNMTGDAAGWKEASETVTIVEVPPTSDAAIAVIAAAAILAIGGAAAAKKIREN